MREGKLPLRTILQNFINHVDTLEAKRAEDDQYDREFQELKLLTETLKSRVDYTCAEGEKDVNRRKNRYKDILPYDYTRVVLSGILGVPGCDYINANYIRGASGSKAYIASQGPLPHTTPDFWRCVVECEVQVIIMASNETEGGKHKCECYWVDKVGEERQYGNITVSYVKGRQVCPDFMVRTLKIKYPNDQGKTEERTICQFHYVLWPDHGVPETVRPLLDMVRLVRDCQASETLPVLVHCSAGCGRTGTICAIDYVWGLLRAGRLSENLDLFGLVKEMRRQRVAMVQTKEQYILLHRAVKELFKERLKVIDNHPYENVATDGTPLILREKESDYEELFVKPEKQDESAKVSPPTTTPSNVSTPTGSLTRYIHQHRINKDESGKTPSPASTPSAVSTPTGSLTRYPSIPQTHRYDTEAVVGSWPGSSNMLERGPPSLLPPGPPLPTKASKAPVPHLTFTSPQHHTYDSTKGSIAPSKLEKNKENAAHKRQVVYQPSITPPLAVSSPLTSPHAPPPPLAVSSPLTSPQAPPLAVSSPLNSPYSASQRMIQLSDSPVPLNASISGPNTPFTTPNSTPANTPNTTPNPLQALFNASTPNSSSQTSLQGGVGTCLAPAPPIRSRTPSPVVAFRRSIENALDSPSDVESKSPLLYHSMEDVQNKSGEQLDRRPSIAKLKEMFEKSVDLDNPGTRLSRSASSVTTRSPTLTLHQDNNSNPRVKRKNSLGAEETLQTKKAYEIIQKSKQINICPPPPSSSEQQSNKGLQHSKSSSCVGKPPSSPVWASPAIRRRPGGIHGPNESQEETNIVLLARVDDRPALPVKKSKSFRSNRPIYSPSNTIASTRSPELSRKKERKDINTYFSLDRGKNEVVPAMSRSESGNIHFIGDIPSPREGFKLSVYQSLPAEGSDVIDSKPQIPPKKSIGDRFKGSRPPEYLCLSSSQVLNASQLTTQQHSDTSSSVSATPSTPPTPQSAPPTVNSIYDAPSLWNRSQHTGGKDSKDKILHDSLNSLPLSSPTSETNLFSSNTSSHLTTTFSAVSPNISPASDVVDSPAGKDYVNARIIRSSNTADDMESPKYVYVPLPSKRTTRDQKSHEYANYNISGSFPRNESQETAENYMEAQDIKKNLPGKFPVYDDVSPSSSISSSQLQPTSSRENLHASQSPATSSSNTPQTPSTPQNADYEMMDFGESSSNVDEVFETVNYEIIGSKEKGKRKDLHGLNSSDDNMSEFLLKRDLDPIARQVYQDCQDYLLHGNNQSPVPSLMPKTQRKDVSKQNSCSRKPGSLLDTSMDVDEVKNKVAVAPQGLRTRERRNSYRQAVNPPSSGNTPTTPTSPTSPTTPSLPTDQSDSADVRKSVHKYETIWFENGKQQQGKKRNNPSPPIQPNLKSSNTHKGSDDIPRSSSSSYLQRPSSPSSVDEQSPNLNNKTTNKEAMFKEKLDELQSLVKSLERQKASARLCDVVGPGGAGDDLGSLSHGSSSASSALQSPSSTLQSRSSKSSKSDAHEPIYANTNTRNAPTPPNTTTQGGTQKYNSSEPKSPQSIRHNVSKEFVESGNPTRNSPTINGSSIYGTIATSTFRHKNDNSSSPNPSYQGQGLAAGQGKPPSPYHSMPPTATLPARPNISPAPYHNIPPPKGFGGTVSAGNSPNPLQEISNRDNGNKESPSAYYKLGMFGSVRGNLRGGGPPGQSDQCGSSGSTSDSPTTKPVSPYSNIPPNAAVMSRSTGNYPQHTPKAHIVGDIAIVAPPRIKRNSSAVVPSSSRGGGHQQPQQQHSQSHWRSGDETEGFSTRNTAQSVKQGWHGGQEEGPPPLIPAKTAAAYQFPLDHPCPSHKSPPHPPTTTQHPPYIQPPPPKPVLKSSLSSSLSNHHHHHHHGHNQHNHQQRHHHQHQPHHHRKVHSSHVTPHISQASAPSSQPSSSTIYQSPTPQTAPAQTSPSSNVDRESQPNIRNVNNHHHSANKKQPASTDGPKNSLDVPKSASNEISEESSDEEGIFHKFSAPNLFKKWISTPNSNSKLSKSGNGAPSSPKSVFYPAVHQSEKETRDEAIETRGNAGSTSSVASKEISLDTCTPTSPKPLVKALGKLKTSSKSVAANFKSYLTPRGDKIENSENVRGTAAGSSLSDHLGGLQKSMSSGNTNSSYTQVQKDYSYPSPLPKKPCGPQDLNLHKSNHTGGVLGSVDTQVKQPRPRQQYL